MSQLVPPEDIETIVGVNRHHSQHWGRAVSKERTVYILHSQECHDTGDDLRQCPYSLAMDNGINTDDWVEDLPVQLEIVMGLLLPTVERRCLVCGCTEERACGEGCCWVDEALCSSCS